MVFIPWEEIGAVSNAAQPAISLARAVTSLGCRVRQAYPGIFDVYQNTVGSNPILPVPALNRYFWDRICRDDPLPNPQDVSSPFYGGQCPILYTVIGSLVRTDLQNPQEAFIDVQGPISQLYIRRFLNTNTNEITYSLNVRGASGTLQVVGIGSHSRTTNPVLDQYVRVRTFFPTDQDNCGNRPFTPTLPATPPTTFNLPVNIGGSNRTVQVSLPGLDTGNWPSFEWTPSISFDGITVDFGVDGIDINFPDGVLPPRNTGGGGDNTQVLNEINNVQNTVNNLQTTVNNQLEIIQGDQQVDLTEILELIKCCSCENDVTYTEQTIASGTTGGVFELPDHTIAVVVSGSPSGNFSVRKQGGGGNSPDVFYWGHIAVCYGPSDGGTRIPLQFESQSIAVESDGAKILVSPYYELTANVTAIVKEKNCNVDG